MSVEKVDRIPLTELSGAIIDGAYRYSLWRTLRAVDHPRRLLFIMLNPSTADAQHSDPTLRRCLGFASSWGYDSLEVCNLFAYRATNPGTLRRVPDPVGPANNEHLGRAVARASVVVAAWGTQGEFMNRAAEVTQLIVRSRRLSCLGLTKHGFPRHPLYVLRTTVPGIFSASHESTTI
jgi:hypothetical protein